MVRVAHSFLLASSALLASVTASHNVSPHNRQWGHYRARGVAPAEISPLSGASIDKSVQQQIQADAHETLAQFTSLPADVQNVLKTAMNNILNQKLYTSTPEEQYQIVSNAIQTQLTKVQTSLPTILGNLTKLDDTGNLAAFQSCINTIIAMGGRQSDADGKCLSNSGFSLDSITKQFNDFVNVNQFVIPANTANAAQQSINDYLNSVELVPSVEYLIGNASQSIQNVLLATAAKDRDATESAFQCWISAISTISEVPLAQRQMQCDTGTTGSTASTKGTTLEDIEERYIDITNQYAGVLPPELAVNIQALGVSTLSVNVGSYDHNVRNAINSAILSATAATSGETSSLVNSLIDCLNTIYDDTPDQTCNPNADPSVLQHNQNIYYNYLAQFVSVLPKTLVQNLNNTVQTDLEGNNTPNADAIRADIEKMWDQASLGTLYESCERVFTDCVVASMTKGTATTSCTDSKGAACQSLPPLAASQIDSSDPYGSIAGGLAGNGNWGTKRSKTTRTFSAEKVDLLRRFFCHNGQQKGYLLGRRGVEPVVIKAVIKRALA